VRPANLGVFAVLVVAGLLFVVSATTARGTQLRTDRGDTVSFVRSEQARHAATLEELARLRRENRQLRQERDILAKAAAWFARETGTIPSGSSGS
jgi:transposase